MSRIVMHRRSLTGLCLGPVLALTVCACAGPPWTVGDDVDHGSEQRDAASRSVVTRVAAGLGVSWSAANTAVLAEGKHRLIEDPARYDGVTTIGVDDSPARFASVREVPPASGVTPGSARST